MPVASFTPSRLHLDYSEWTAPGIAYNGQVWAWNNTSGAYEPTALAFDPAGTAAAAISTHLAAGNPHTQYLLASGVSAFGATLIDDASAATARTTLGLGTAAVLNVGTSASNVVQLNGSGQLPAVDGSLLTGISGGGGGTPGGSTTQVQYNNAGAFAGDAGMTYNVANARLTVAGGIVAPSMRPASDSTTALQWQDAAGTAVVTGDSANGRLHVGSTSVIDTSSWGTSGRYLTVFNASGVEAGATLQVGSHRNSNGAGTGAFEFMNLANSGGTGGGNRTLVSIYSAIETSNSNSTRDCGGALKFFTKSQGSLGSVKMSLTGAGLLGVGVDPTALLDLAASTATRASLRIRVGTAPTTPNTGDIWYPTGGRLNVYRAATETIASGVPGTGGAATAGASYTSAEQSMIQKVYDAARAFGLLS